jgi:hypothetical protein
MSPRLRRACRRVLARTLWILRLLVMCLAAMGPGAPPPPPSPRRQAEVQTAGDEEEDEGRT